MDFVVDDTQAQVVASVEAILQRTAGPTRARSVLYEGDGHDDRLAAEIAAAGFAEAFADEGAGPLAVALVVEAVARQVGCIPLTGPLLVAPAVLERTDLTALTLVDGRGGPVRYAVPGPALVLEGDDARLVELGAGDLERVPVPYAFPMARVRVPGGGRVLPGAAGEVRAWWRTGLALEMSGAMQGAMALAVAYVGERHQFGRPIGAFQSIQHRLAWAASAVEGARWLALETAWAGAPAGAAASAASFASAAAARVLRDAHQVHGAIGFTVEADLHLWTLRLQALRLELGGADRHRRAAGAEWLAARAP